MISVVFILMMIGLISITVLKIVGCGCEDTRKGLQQTPREKFYSRTDDIAGYLNELVDIQTDIANELARANDIAEGKRDLTDYDPNWSDIPGMEKSDG